MSYSAFGLYGLLLLWLEPASAAPRPHDLRAEVLAVFTARCAGCHGPNLAKPKGRFGYVLDLARVAGNREMVVPSSPEESELWELIRRGEMPPADAPTGPLSAEQKEVIRAWIAAGAPAAEVRAAPPPEPVDRDEDPGASEVSVLRRALGRLGPLHVVAVHFPIALLIVAAAAELWSAWRGERTPTPTVYPCLLLGAAGALAAATLGWLHAWNGYGAGMPLTLNVHRWTGTAAAGWALGAAWLCHREQLRGTRSPWFRAWLLFGAVLVGVSAHFGGVLVHGEDFLAGG